MRIVIQAIGETAEEAIERDRQARLGCSATERFIIQVMSAPDLFGEDSED